MKNTNSYYQEDLLLLSSTLSKILKRRFGKGPEMCFVTLHSNRIFAFIRKYITPAEDVLLKNDNVNLVYKFRSAVMKDVIDEFIWEVKDSLGMSFDSYFEDWNFNRNTGMLILENSQSRNWINTDIHPALKEKLFEGISVVNNEIYKAPTSMEIIKINQNMYALECRDTLIQMEKILYNKGYFGLLQERSNDIKNSYFLHKKKFEFIFETKVEDIFLFWDYKNDRSYMIFYLL
ncbi:Na-translocating system protein MpsC family protein [Metabacillus halosaccharovorans]|uniref:Na-translocating system protein MpsC family protein n=1 Tax=Metabacillus halosaccharovorans TaxID=930124 RepID=UPI0009956EE8|nr:Na-translocating system protein MpsC family protein [Metabacillus halosaccharovorans]